MAKNLINLSERGFLCKQMIQSDSTMKKNIHHLAINLIQKEDDSSWQRAKMDYNLYFLGMI